MSKKSLVAFTILTSLVLSATLARADQLSDARAGLEKRFEQLRDVRIEYDLHEVHAAPPGPLTRVGKVASETIRRTDGTIETRKYPPGQEKTVTTRLLAGEITKHCIWRRCNDCIRLDTSDDGTAPEALRSYYAIISAYGDRQDVFAHQASISQRNGKEVWERKPAWWIAKREGDPIAQIDVALGLRIYDEDRLMTVADLRGLEVVRCDDDTLILSLLKGNGLHLLHFSAKYGWALERYQLFQQGLPAADWRAEDFLEVNGLWLPHAIKMRFKSPLVGPEWPGKSLEITVKKVDFAPQDGGEASFPLVFPNGSIVSDARSGLPFEVRSGEQTIPDEKIAVRVEAYRRFEKEVQEKISNGWKPTEQELNEMMAKHFEGLKR